MAALIDSVPVWTHYPKCKPTEGPPPPLYLQAEESTTRKLIIVAWILAASFVLNACDQMRSQPPSQSSAKAPEAVPVLPSHHFTIVPNTDGGLAVIDDTGQMCLTWPASRDQIVILSGERVVLLHPFLVILH